MGAVSGTAGRLGEEEAAEGGKAKCTMCVSVYEHVCECAPACDCMCG